MVKFFRESGRVSERSVCVCRIVVQRVPSSILLGRLISRTHWTSNCCHCPGKPLLEGAYGAYELPQSSFKHSSNSSLAWPSQICRESIWRWFVSRSYSSACCAAAFSSEHNLMRTQSTRCVWCQVMWWENAPNRLLHRRFVVVVVVVVVDDDDDDDDDVSIFCCPFALTTSHPHSTDHGPN